MNLIDDFLGLPSCQKRSEELDQSELRMFKSSNWLSPSPAGIVLLTTLMSMLWTGVLHVDNS